MKRLLILLWLAGCAMNGAGNAVTLDAARSGDRVSLTLRNGSSAPVGYNLCTSALQRSQGGSWTAIETGEVCTMELRTLEPGQTATFEKTLPAGLSAGEYRYVTRAEGADVASNPFAVE